MRRITITLLDGGVSLSDDVLGRAGEVGAVQLVIDYSAISMEGVTAARLRFKPSGSAALEMDELTLPASGPLSVTVPDWAMSVSGTTRAQLNLVGDGLTVKSYVWDMIVQESLLNLGTIPDPMQEWIDDASTAVTAANAAAAAALAAADVANAAASANNAGAHNSIYRGKNLGSSVTAAQYAAIQAGTFEDMYIGDYWTIGGVGYRIAAFDYYLRCGDQYFATHHAVIVPDSNLYNAKMNETNTTGGGYVGSAMYKTGLEQAKTTIKAAFNGHVLKHRVYLTNAVTNGKPSAGAWCDSEVELMNEQMVYGGAIFMPGCDGTTVPTNYRVEKSQLPLFTHRPDLISNRLTFWLRDVVTASDFALVVSGGYANCLYASNSLGVRPAFSIS